MRAYFRVSPRFGLSMPWWLALVAWMIWLELALIYWLGVALLAAVILSWRAGRRAWVRWRPPAPQG